MRLNWKALMPALLILIMTACFEKAPLFSTVPSIEFSNLCYSEGFNETDADTLVLTLKFKDGDGDLGLSAGDPLDNAGKYSEKNYFTLGNSVKISYKDKRTNPKYKSLPAFLPPFSCTNWEVVKDANQLPVDTIYFEYNAYHNNILIDFYTKNNDGTFTKYDFTKFFIYPNCAVGGYNGRFPILSNDLNKKSPLEGTIKYNLKSPYFLLTFSIKTLKIKVTIIDRVLNKSNELETPEFTLQSINCN